MQAATLRIIRHPAPTLNHPTAPPIALNAHSHEHGHGEHHRDPTASATRNLPAIEQLITQANLPDRAQRWSLAVFQTLARAEAAVHGIAIDQVHFHEVGAIDAIVDIVGACLGFDYLNIDTLVCSPLPTGRGRVRAAHGWLPVPAPAVLKLLEQHRVPLYSNGLDGELVTPTGAAIATTLAHHFGDPPAMTLHRTGLGAGGKTLPVANALRLWIGVAEAGPASSPTAPSPTRPLATQPQPPTPEQRGQPPDIEVAYDRDTVILLETQVDDLVPQAIGYLYDRLFAVGALDVFTQPVSMKKSRPGLLLTVICRPDHEPRCTDILFAETSTLGIRRQPQQRWVLPRSLQTLETPYGPISLKLAYHPQTQSVLNAQPEYEDCAAAARDRGIPWQVVYHAALSTWYCQPSRSPELSSD
ncbi:nickel pincer cofactor biosynthesis protein LarC [Leptolyngbya sp. KIOST-1]|uniref:nickel pincer cofactor biosynthesis protein LarC n=1 Tax=Leptolyngbya sp. KIOST-1 TaxID=1229172 RepID=UPI0009DEA942|nr:nickel pincer cofactor biosynthesis protein LarC [Leptolyngbya sp. KIOST-1]